MTYLFTGINAIEFGRRFQSQEDCYRYLYSIKWKDGYRCKFCGCTDDIKGKTSFHRRCKSCKTDESVTANTLFHGLRMSILKAFHLLFRTMTKKMGMSSVELSTEVGVQQKTAWKFKLKVKNAMVQEKQRMLQGVVQVDETLVGGYSKGNVGRSLAEKSAVLIAVEDIGEGKTGNIRMEIIESFKAEIFDVAIDNMVENGSSIKTDNHKSYNKLKKRERTYRHLIQIKGICYSSYISKSCVFKTGLGERTFAVVRYIYRLTLMNMFSDSTEGILGTAFLIR